MIGTLSDAIIAHLAPIPGVATCERYAGQLEGSARSLIRVPALLLHIGEWKAEADPGTGEVNVLLRCSLFVAARNARGAEARAAAVDDLCEAVLPLLRMNNWGVAGVGPAALDRVVPHYVLEAKGVGLREVRWTQSVTLGESIWDGDGVTPTEIWVGWSPEAFPDDYEQQETDDA